MGHGPGWPVKPRGWSGLLGTVDVVEVGALAVHHISMVAVPVGPSKQMGPSWAGRCGRYTVHISWGAARPGPSNFERMSRGPAHSIIFQGTACGPPRPVKRSEDGPCPGPSHQFFRGCAMARPSPSRFKKFTAWPVWPTIFSKASARPAWPITWQRGP